MIEGTLEAVTPDGTCTGWLRDDTQDTPAVVEIRAGTQTLAQAVARDFRPDLLRGGHGHGHYGFAARLTLPLPPGAAILDVFLPRHGQAIRVRVDVPRLAPPGGATVEHLLRAPLVWSPPELLAALPCLALSASRAAMGTARFIDASFQFALGRWPHDAEHAVYLRALTTLGLSEEDFLAELLTSRECTPSGRALPSPWDATFPYSGVLTHEANAEMARSQEPA